MHNVVPVSSGAVFSDQRFLRRTAGDEVGLVGRAEAEVVQSEERGPPLLLRQVRQQLQGAAHPEDALLAVLCEREIDQQPQPRAQRAPAAAAAPGGREGGFAPPRFGRWHRQEGLKKITLEKREMHKTLRIVQTGLHYGA